jgi:protein-tyrosine kinase
VQRLALRKDKNTLDDKSRSLISHFSQKSAIAERYRTIRTNIEFSSAEKDLRSILVTSTAPGEGKSTTVANLAVVIAQQGKKVLLVDADLRKPTAHYTFDKNNLLGLTNVLTGQISLGEATTSTEVPNLDLLTSGPIPPNPAELLGSAALDELKKVALASYDLILFDTPPVLAVTDAQVLANKCDGVVLVVSSNKTDIKAVLKAKDLLKNAKAKLLGVILNQKQTKLNDYYYYYGEK